jgi:hypothetical protein
MEIATAVAAHNSELTVDGFDDILVVEIRTMNLQSEMTAITVTLRTEP